MDPFLYALAGILQKVSFLILKTPKFPSKIIRPLKAGADVSKRDRKGWSASDYLEDGIRKEIVNCERLEGEKLLKKLRSMEKPTSIPREKSGVLHSQMTTEGKEIRGNFCFAFILVFYSCLCKCKKTHTT